jgi:DNA-damage-inducible protein J
MTLRMGFSNNEVYRLCVPLSRISLENRGLMVKNQRVRAIILLVNPLETESSVCKMQYNILFIIVFIRFPSSATYVRARIDTVTKERATEALAVMGLSVSDAIHLLILRIADERCLPFKVKVPNAATRQAIAELEA